MINSRFGGALALILLAAGNGLAAMRAPSPDYILADTALLREARISILDSDASTGVALARLDPLDELLLSRLAHENGKCGGYLRLPTDAWLSTDEAREAGRRALLELAESHRRILENRGPGIPKPIANPRIAAAVARVEENRLEDTVKWLSSYPTRMHRSSDANTPVQGLRVRLDALLGAAPQLQAKIELIDHQGTPQKSIRVRIPGTTRPDEIVVLGAHLDSINSGWGETRAPGADDNASGSANLLEALRILTLESPPERTIEFYWYAGEEGGLIGSAEIAKDYSRQKKSVIGVLQLDMTLFAGDGEFVLGSMTDFTSPKLRSWFVELNQTYIGARIIEDKCGYGCSDHASWHTNGYPALMPFEASFKRMFPDLHTTRDVISERSSFRHSAMFSRIAVAFAMDLAGYP